LTYRRNEKVSPGGSGNLTEGADQDIVYLGRNLSEDPKIRVRKKQGSVLLGGGGIGGPDHGFLHRKKE